ncbi:hypothetical protein D0Y65_001567, partial [Glycine soja]
MWVCVFGLFLCSFFSYMKRSVDCPLLDLFLSSLFWIFSLCCLFIVCMLVLIP